MTIPAPADEPIPPRTPIAGPVAVGLVLLVVYLANGREIGQYDTEGTTLTAYALMRGDGLDLDRFAPIFAPAPGASLPDFLTWSGGRIVSRYPVAAAFLAVPLEYPQLLALDRLRPGWDSSPGGAWDGARILGKHAAAVIAALTGALFYAYVRACGFRTGISLAATAAVALGSDLWTVGSQALWQHGPAALFLLLGLHLTRRPDPSHMRLLAAGFVAAGIAAIRAIDVVLSLALFAWVARIAPRRLPAFLVGPSLVGVLLLSYNVRTFGTLSGGQAELEAMHPRIHGVAGPWSGNVVQGALGTLFSPARGLFVYSPWALLALGLAPCSWRNLKSRPQAAFLVPALAAHGIVVSKYAVWWAGHTFGPRYWTEVMPLWGLLFAAGLEFAAARARPVLLLAAILVAWSIAVQIVGATCFPSSWNLRPANVDRAHERLWDWTDTEITRALDEARASRGRDPR